jgi:cytosine/adenosine deaminase-related metal-dependent hydrolase
MSVLKRTPFFRKFYRRVEALGGMHNAHLHLDRAGILDPHYFVDNDHDVLRNSHISLHQKHHLINTIHNGPAYDTDDLTRRVNECLDDMVACKTRRADTLVDVTADRVQLSALHTLQQIKQQREAEIEILLGAYSPLGFNDREPQRWEIFAKGVSQADFIAALPEADDTDDYPDNIGFMEHCRRTLELAAAQGKMIHVHTDQRNEPSENGTEQLLEAIDRYGAPQPVDGEPMVWAVHMISPSTYDEARFERLVDNLLRHQVGVICCPSAAIGMRQIRPLMTPTYNSIPRVLELAAAGVPVRIASDNIADICSPTTTADLTDEVLVLSAALRFYHPDILAKFAVGTTLDDAERRLISDHLAKNQQEIDNILQQIEPYG